LHQTNMEKRLGLCVQAGGFVILIMGTVTLIISAKT
jgi:hypothetical protein